MNNDYGERSSHADQRQYQQYQYQALCWNKLSSADVKLDGLVSEW